MFDPEEAAMKRKLFVLSLLGILIIQPLVVLYITSGEAAADSKREKLMLAQEPGTRLLPEDHTNHVPIIIDGDDDFVAQGWPGTGIEADPYVI
jgi:hypothetical protein